ncbi:Plant protein of unknown function (DUF247 [Striga hermonthica]|uniref:Uncharacterized protein n=1 Tax=Striga hermonthica TaxID=68872 RepID=A0A9N7NHK9_STRHE|nr:Plant protein of unknown function (DUF247 [Striga hermonthica]
MSETRDHVSVLIDSSLHLSSDSPSSPTIFRVNHDMRHDSEKLYDPKVVSIGPYHHQTAHLQKMQPLKHTYLRGLLARRGESTVDRYVAAVRPLEEKARNSYSDPIGLNPDELVKILVVDGLFVVELLRKNGLDEVDPIFRYQHVPVVVKRDLMLVENQVPFFVLYRLFAMTRGENPHDNIFYLVRYFADDISPWREDSDFRSTSKPVENYADDHLHGLVYKILFEKMKSDKKNVEQQQQQEETKVEFERNNCLDITFVKKILFKKRKAGRPVEGNFMTINSASELQETGIKFQRSTSPFITFNRGVLSIPKLYVADETESILKNLIVYEQFFTGDSPKYVKDYTFFLQCLVNQPKDVEILRQHGILGNLLGEDKMVCPLFGSLGRDTLTSPYDFYAGVCKEVNGYCNRRGNRWMAVLRRDYFNNPWSFIKFCAASLLLLLTVIQTLFTVLGYGNARSN